MKVRGNFCNMRAIIVRCGVSRLGQESRRRVCGSIGLPAVYHTVHAFG